MFGLKSDLILLLLFLSSGLFAQENFTELVEENQLVFTMPEGFTSVPIKENRDLSYSYAITNSEKSIEVRYTIWPMKELMVEYQESLKDSNSIMVPPNNIYKARLQANTLNMTGGKMFPIDPFPTQAVEQEFNADAGGSCFFEFNCEFGKGFKYGHYVYLHRENVADVLITFMTNDKETHSDLMMLAFYSMTFESKNKFHFAEKEGNAILSNKNETEIVKINVTTVNVPEVMAAIQASDIADKALIIRVLEMQPSNEFRLIEIFKLSKTSLVMHTILYQHLMDYLEKNYSPEEIEELSRK